MLFCHFKIFNKVNYSNSSIFNITLKTFLLLDKTSCNCCDVVNHAFNSHQVFCTCFNDICNV